MKPSLDRLSREEIQIIAKHSNWNQQKVEEKYKTHIYPNKEQWVKFIKYFLLAIGIGFLTAGVVFFFAYNWDNLHKFIKLGLIQGSMIALGATALLAPISKNFRLILLTSLAILIGVLFAVYGQVYQTGANAYDLFLMWTFAVFLMACAMNYAPMWLILVLLTETTFTLYFQQHGAELSIEKAGLYYLWMHAGFTLFFIIAHHYLQVINAPKWLNYLLFVILTYTLLGIVCPLIFVNRTDEHLSIFLSSGIMYVVSIIYSISKQNVLFLSLILLSLIIIFTCIFVKAIEGDYASPLLGICFFVIVSVGGSIKLIAELQKLWKS